MKQTSDNQKQSDHLIGDWVFVYQISSPRWIGPCRIIDVDQKQIISIKKAALSPIP